MKNGKTRIGRVLVCLILVLFVSLTVLPAIAEGADEAAAGTAEAVEVAAEAAEDPCQRPSP